MVSLSSLVIKSSLAKKLQSPVCSNDFSIWTCSWILQPVTMAVRTRGTIGTLCLWVQGREEAVTAAVFHSSFRQQRHSFETSSADKLRYATGKIWELEGCVSTTIQLLARHGSWPVVTHNKSQPFDCEHSTTTDDATNRLHLQILGISSLISFFLQHVRHTWTSTSLVSVFLQRWNTTEQPQWLLFSTTLTCIFHNTCSCFIYEHILWKNIV